MSVGKASIARAVNAEKTAKTEEKVTEVKVAEKPTEVKTETGEKAAEKPAEKKTTAKAPAKKTTADRTAPHTGKIRKSQEVPYRGAAENPVQIILSSQQPISFPLLLVIARFPIQKVLRTLTA